ncbi:MAG: lysophospholipid acyltransferase family protein [Gammaproteobacteria bacterium]|nr:lysophospholipid acyltransferase family protein [Gammaproteobacteria bacterium]
MTQPPLKGRLPGRLIDLIARLPLSLQHRLGTWLGLFFWAIRGRERTATEINLQLCFPDQSAQWRDRLGRQSMIHTGKALLETGAMWRWPEDRLCELVTSVKNRQVFDRALAGNQGLLLASPHIGAWELIAVYINASYPMVNMYRPARSATLDPIIRNARERFGAQTAPANASGVRTILKALRENQVIGILPDQEPDRENGVFAPLFNTPACTMTLLGKLAQKNRTPVVFCVMKRLKKGFELEFLEPLEDFYNPDPLQAATAINQAVERCIAIAPEQYLWSYRRFRLLQEGGKRQYSRP